MLFKALNRSFLAEDLRICLAYVFDIFWSAFLGQNWRARHNKYVMLERIYHLLQDRLLGYYVRRIGNLAQTKYPDGVMLLPFQGCNMSVIGMEIYFNQVYDGFYKMQENDVAIDIGAHVGVFTLKAAKRARMVVAVEPHPFNYRLLLKNVALNSLRNVIPVKLALSDYDGIAKLYIAKNSGCHTIKREMRGIFSPCIGCLKVEVKTLDRLADELKLSRVSFIKIDAEGAELAILKGAKKLLEENDIFLAIAAYHNSMEAHRVSRYLRRKGFIVFSSTFNKSTYIYAFKPSTSSRAQLIFDK